MNLFTFIYNLNNKEERNQQWLQSNNFTKTDVWEQEMNPIFNYSIDG